MLTRTASEAKPPSRNTAHQGLYSGQSFRQFFGQSFLETSGYFVIADEENLPVDKRSKCSINRTGLGLANIPLPSKVRNSTFAS